MKRLLFATHLGVGIRSRTALASGLHGSPALVRLRGGVQHALETCEDGHRDASAAAAGGCKHFDAAGFTRIGNLPKKTLRKIQKTVPLTDALDGSERHVKSLCKELLRIDPQLRITAADALDHPAVRGKGKVVRGDI